MQKSVLTVILGISLLACQDKMPQIINTASQQDSKQGETIQGVVEVVESLTRFIGNNPVTIVTIHGKDSQEYLGGFFGHREDLRKGDEIQFKLGNKLVGCRIETRQIVQADGTVEVKNEDRCWFEITRYKVLSRPNAKE